MDKYKPLKHQIAGHFTYGENEISCILEKGNRIFKLIKAPPKGHEEILFYRTFVRIQTLSTGPEIKSSASATSDSLSQYHTSTDSTNLLDKVSLSPELLDEFQRFTSKFYGISTINGHDYIELDNLYSNFKNPCLADIKMGRYNYDPQASEEKRKRRIAKFPPRLELGYSFSGIKTDQIQLKKDFGRSLTIETISEAFEKFLPSYMPDRVAVVEKFMPKLEALRQWFETQTSMQFYCSSLFMVYCRTELTVNVKMIDFAHVFYEPGRKDENYLLGLTSLIRDFKNSIQ